MLWEISKAEKMKQFELGDDATTPQELDICGVSQGWPITAAKRCPCRSPPAFSVESSLSRGPTFPFSTTTYMP